MRDNFEFQFLTLMGKLKMRSIFISGTSKPKHHWTINPLCLRSVAADMEVDWRGSSAKSSTWVSDQWVSDCVGLSWWLFFFFPFPIVGGDEVVGL